MPRIKRREQSSTSAAEIADALDHTAFFNGLKSILSQGGALMVGQTRDNSKLIITVYLDGDADKEYCEDAREALEFIGQYQV